MSPETFPGVSKGTVLKTWEPYVVIPLWSRRAHLDDVPYTKTLPGYLPCPVLSQLQTSSLLPVQLQNDDVQNTKNSELERFVVKLIREESLDAVALLTTMEIIMARDDWNNRTLVDESSSSFVDEEFALLVEGWPLIQDTVSWKTCSTLYRRVHSKIHLVTLPHPLSEFAKDSLLQMPENDFQQAVRAGASKKWIPKYTSNRLQASQFFLDYVASLASRRVGVLLEDPCCSLEEPTTTTVSQLSQSCIPSAMLELSVSSSSKGRSTQCSLISLYDSTTQPDEGTWTISTRPVVQGLCQCLWCQYGRQPEACLASVGLDRIEEFQRLAHTLFLNEKYDGAKALYQLCHDKLLQVSSDRVILREKADLWHAMGAVELTQHQFIKAQNHWREGEKLLYHTHPGISLQLEKQQAYGYWDPLPPIASTSSNFKTCCLDHDTISFPQQQRKQRRLFLTPSMVPTDTCEQLIEWAEEFGSKSPGWTTQRHYAVPTNDVPVHKVPKILAWFQQWMNTTVQALLRQQFETSHRFYVHDAFVVRYSAAAKSRFLPLHHDESTHSMVLALNDNYKGGGTYFYNVDQTITPSTARTGSLVTFRGNQLLHGGNVVTQGVRYILAVFLYLDDDDTTTSSTNSNSCWKKNDELGSSSKRQKMLGGGEGTEGFSFSFF